MSPLPDANGESCEIGSVAGRDPAAAAKSAFELYPWLPSVPELPRLAPSEGILVRDLGPLRWVVGGGGSGSLVLTGGRDLVRELDDAEVAEGPPSDGFMAFLDALRSRRPVPERVKIAVAGPVLLAQRLVDGKGRTPAASPEVAEAVARYVVRRAVDLASRAAACGPAVVIQLDEPGTTDALDTASFWRLASTIGAIRSAGHLAAVHDCGARDGRKLLLLAPDLLLVDGWGPSTPFAAHGEALGGYLRAGGTVAWGLLPTRGVAPEPRRTARALLDRLGVEAGDRDVVRRRGLVSPSCGFGASTLVAERRVRAALRIARAAWR